MAAQIDHRLFTLPMVILGAAALALGLVGAGIEATTDVGVNDPLGWAGAGATMLLAGLVVMLASRRPAPRAQDEDRLPIPLEPRARRHRRVAAVVSGVVALALVAAIFGPSGLAGVTGGEAEPPPDVVTPGAIDAPASLDPLSVDAFSGELQGATLPVAGGVGSASSQHELALPANASAARIELQWSAGQGGSDTLQVVVEAQDGMEWVEVASGSGASVLVVDADRIPEGATKLRVTVSLPGGSTGQAYEGHASSFAGEIPVDYSAF